MNQQIFSALAEPHRFLIVELLRDQPYPVGEIADRLRIGQPQTSKHLKVLAEAGLVEMRPVANQRIYELSPAQFQEMDRWLENYRTMWETRFDRLDKLLKRQKVRSFGRR